MTNFDTQFWREVAAAHERVSVDASMEVTVERENKHAFIRAVDGSTLILISDAPNEKPPALVVPPGQGRR